MEKQIGERLVKLETKILEHNKRLETLENHVYHPPHIQRLLNEIKNRSVVTIKELKQHFPKLHGGMLTRLYEAARANGRYRIIPGCARWSPTVIAYFGDEAIPNDPILLAVDYFQRIPLAGVTYTLDAMGKRRKSYRGKQGSLKGIMAAYTIDKDKAYQVWQEILGLFKARMLIDHAHKRFRRKY